MICVMIWSALRYLTVSSSPENVRLKSLIISLIRFLSRSPSQSQKALMLSIFSTRAILEKLHEPSNATLLIPSENIPHFECAIPLPTLGVIIFISIRSCLISQDKHSKKCSSRLERVYDIRSIALRSKYGVFTSDSPTIIALRSSSDKISLIINLILPPL